MKNCPIANDRWGARAALAIIVPQALGKVAQHSKSKNNFKRGKTFSKIRKSNMDFVKLHDT